MTTNELSEKFEQKRVSGHLKNVLIKLKRDGLLEQTIPDKPNHPNQKHKLTKKGISFLKMISKESDQLATNQT